MQFGKKKYGVLVRERGKVVRADEEFRLEYGQDMKDIDEADYR